MFVHRIANPVDLGITPDCFVERINAHNLIELVRRILRHPVGAEYAQRFAFPANALLSDSLVRALVLEAVDALVGGLTVGGTLGHGALAAAAADADTVDDVALLGAVAEAAGLIRAGGPRGAVDGGELAILPAAHAQQEAQHVALLLAVQLLHVLVRSHDKANL